MDEEGTGRWYAGRLYLPLEGSSAVKGRKFLILSVVFMAAGICSFLLFASSFHLPRGNTHTTLQPRSREERNRDEGTRVHAAEERERLEPKERKTSVSLL